MLKTWVTALKLYMTKAAELEMTKPKAADAKIHVALAMKLMEQTILQGAQHCESILACESFAQI